MRRAISPRPPLGRVRIGFALTFAFALLCFPAVAWADITATEGQSFSGQLVATGDCGSAPGPATIDWGDGTTSPGTRTADGMGVQGTHTYLEEGGFSGTVTYDCPQQSDFPLRATFQAAVHDASLTSSGQDAAGAAGRPVSAVVAHVADANPGAGTNDLSAQIAWGDGTTTPGTVTAAAGGGFDVTGTHTYGNAASYPVSTSVSDIGGSMATANSTAQIAPTAPPPPSGSKTVARARAAGISKTLKGGLWLSGTDSVPNVGTRIVDYSWAIDNGPYTPCGPSPVASMTFRGVGAHRVSLRVTDSAGAESFSNVGVNAIRSAVNSQAAFDCENPAAGGNQPSRADCVKVFAWSIVEVGSRGAPGDCFKLDQLIDKGKLTPIHYGAAASAHAASIPQLFVYSATITGPVAINGLYVPVPSGHKTFYNSLDSTVGVGNVSLSLGPLGSKDLNLNLKVKPERIAVGGCYSRSEMGYHLPTNGLLKGDTKIAGLPIGGSLAVDLLYRTSRITAMVSLPNIFKLSNDAPVQGTVCLNADNTHGVSLEGLTVSVPAAMIGPVELKNLSFTYLKTQNVLSGGATVILTPGGYEINASPPPPDHGFGLKNGRFDHAGFDFAFGRGEGPVLYPGVQLHHIGISIGIDPLRFTGEAGVTVAGIVDIDGEVFVIFATPGSPYDYPFRDSGPLKGLSGKRFDSFALAVGGAATLAIPGIDPIALGDSYVLYKYPDYFETKGTISLRKLLGVLDVSGTIGGFVDGSAQKFNFEGKLQICLSEFSFKVPIYGTVTIHPCLNGGGVISSKGIGACASIPVPIIGDVGFRIGYVWKEGVRAGFSCDLGDFEEQATRAHDLPGRARTAAVGGFTLPPRLEMATVRLTGSSAAPDAILTLPDGRTISTASATVTKDLLVAKIPGLHQTLIGIRHPPAGRWSVSPAAGSAPLTELGVAKSLPKPNIVVHVRRRGRTAILSYRVTAAPGRQVTFQERGPATARVIGTARGSRGTLKFLPGNGPSGNRQVVALVTQSGIPVRDVVVATYRARGPLRVGTPTHVRIVRHKSLLTISWAPVPGAAGYATTLSLSNGHDEMSFSRRSSVTFIGADTVLRGGVAVLALGANGTRGTLGRTLVPAAGARHRGRR